MVSENQDKLKMDDEVMRFEITDQDLEDEMTNSYGKKRMSKNQQIYGVWADNSDEVCIE